MRRRRGIEVPGGASTGPVAAVKRVYAAVIGRNDEPDVPAGWQHVGFDENGAPMFAFIGPWRNPHRQDLERLAEAVRKRFG